MLGMLAPLVAAAILSAAGETGALPAAENVRVVLRVRPLTRKEADRGEDELIRVASEQTVQVSAGVQKGGKWRSSVHRTMKEIQEKRA